VRSERRHTQHHRTDSQLARPRISLSIQLREENQMTTTRDYIRSVELPVPPTPKRDRGKEATFGSDQQAVVVASQMAEFTPKVPQTTRPVLSHGLLLGQLAADKAAGETPDIFRWYDAYSLVMRRIGWLLQDIDFKDEQLAESDLEAHKAIIPVITTILGPAAAAASIIISVLEGLDKMNKGSDWLTLYERKSLSAQGGKFQMSYIDADPGGDVTMKTAFFGIDAQQKITQVLFFRFSNKTARLKGASSEMTLSAELLDDIASPLREKVAPFIVENIKNIEI
jgi:hypothetical protein